MLKKILAVLAMLYAAACFAAVDVNKATAADLDGIKGIGPVMSKRILDERKKGGEFKSWEDLIARIKGIGDPTAAKFSAGGLTINGTEYKRAALSKGDEKKGAKADAKADKKDEKAEKKDDKAVARSDKKDDKATAAKPAASAARK